LPVFANTCADEMALVDWTDEQKHISLQMHILKLNPTSNLSRWPGFLFQSEDALCFELSSPGVKASMAGQTPGYL